MCGQNLNKVKKVILVMTRVADNANLALFFDRSADRILTRDIFVLVQTIENSEHQ